MKKYNLAINLLLIFCFIASVIAFAVIGDMTHNHWFMFNEVIAPLKDNPEFAQDYNEYLNETLCLTFSIIFSALTAIASAVTFALLNFKVWKKKKD